MKITLLTKREAVVVKPYIDPITKIKHKNLFYTDVSIVFSLDGDIITIPRGFVTDLGSIPKAFRFMVSNAGKSTMAFIIHDYFGKKNTYTLSRLTSDVIMYKVARLCGQNKYEATLTFLGTRIGGMFLNYYQKESPRYMQYTNNGTNERTSDVVTCSGLCEKCQVCFK